MTRARTIRSAAVRNQHTRCRGGHNNHFREALPMLTLRLPDGSTKQVAEGTRPREVAESIGKRLAQAAIAAKINGQIIDLDREFSSIEDLNSAGAIPFQVL